MFVFIANDKLAFTDATSLLRWLDRVHAGWQWVDFTTSNEALTQMVNKPGRYRLLLPGETEGAVQSYPLQREHEVPYMPNQNLARIDAPGKPSPPLESDIK